MLFECDAWPKKFFWRSYNKLQTVNLPHVLRQTKLMYNSDGVALSPDGKMYASYDKRTRALQLADLETGKPLGAPIADQEKINQLCFSPDGQILAAGYADATIRLWDVHSHQPLGPPLQGHDTGVFSLAFRPDGKVLASGSRGNSAVIFLWDITSGKPPVHSSPLLSSDVNTLAFSPDGKSLVSGHSDQTIRLWDAASLKPLGPPLHDHDAPVIELALSPDGLSLASMDSQGKIKLWDVASRQPLCDICEALGRVAFSVDGQALICWTELYKGNAWRAANFKAWQISMEALRQRACRLANRNLSHAEWQRYLSGLPYRKTCPDLPTPED
jgi:WD40 repeat protein